MHLKLRLSAPQPPTHKLVERHFTSLQSGPGFQSHWSPLRYHPSASDSRQREREREGWMNNLKTMIHTCDMCAAFDPSHKPSGGTLAHGTKCFSHGCLLQLHLTDPHTQRGSDDLEKGQRSRQDSLAHRQTHSSSRQEFCGTAVLIRRPSLGAVAPVLGSETTTLPLFPSPSSSSPLCWPRFIRRFLPLSPPPDGLPGLLECHWWGDGNMPDQRQTGIEELRCKAQRLWERKKERWATDGETLSPAEGNELR